MPVVRYVAFYPPTGFRDRPWIDHRASDLLAKSGRRVAEVYSREIATSGLNGKSSEVRVFLRAAPPGQDHVTVDVHVEYVSGFESAVALIPDSVEDLGADDRAELAFEILSSVVHELAPHRGWPFAALATAERASRECGLEFTWYGPWKSSPSRRDEARGAFWLEDNAFGRGLVEVRERGAADAPILRSADGPAYCTAAGFARSANTLRWDDDTVRMTTSIDILGQAEGEIRFDPVTGSAGIIPARQRISELPARSQLRVEVTASGRVPDSHTIRGGGGGPTNGVPRTYLDGLHGRLESLKTGGLAWWSGADRTLLEISFEITDTEHGIKVRRLKDHVTAVIRRPLGALNPANGDRAAHDDVSALIEAVSTRMNLTDRPSI